MQEVLQIVIKRLRALEDAYHENARALETMEHRIRETSSGELGARIEAAERRIAGLDNASKEIVALAEKVQALEEQRDEEVQASLVKRIAELGQVVAGLHASQQSLREAVAAPSVRADERADLLEERFENLESSIGDFRAMADHVIEHEATLATLEHHLAQQSTNLGAIEEQAATYKSQFEIFDRQLAAHRSDMNAIDEHTRTLEVRIEDLGAGLANDETVLLAERIEAVEQQIASPAEHPGLAARINEVTGWLEETADRLSMADARSASLNERFSALESMHNEVSRHAEEIAVLRANIGETTGERLEIILDRLEGLDRLAADVASHSGQLATIRGRQIDTPPVPIVVSGEQSPETHARLDELTRHVRELRESATMMESIRTLLAGSDIEKVFDELKEHIARLDAQVATLFTLQRMTSEDDAPPSVLSLEQD